MTATAGTVARTPEWIVRATGGRRVDRGDAPALAGTVTTDTRTLAPGDLFVALPGQRTDGGRFVKDALQRGAHGVIAMEHDLPRSPSALAIAVADPLEALYGLARAWRAALPLRHVVAVTGSVGKTTTKDLIAAILAAHGPAHATANSFNTFSGVPATIAAAPPDTELLVVEVAMRGAGDIARKAALVRPTAGIITTIAPSHLDTSGTIEAVARHKAELIEALPPGAPCVVPAGAALLAPYLRADLDTITAGPGGDAQLRSFDGTTAEIVTRERVVRVRPGFAQAHNLDNLVGAVALTEALGLGVGEHLEATLSPYRWQRERTEHGVDVIADCFSIIPTGLRRALDAFGAEPARRRVAVLGPMLHLADARERLHHELGAHAAAVGVDVLVTVGPGAEAYAAGFPGEHHHVQSPVGARGVVAATTRPGDLVLLKGPYERALWEFLT